MSNLEQVSVPLPAELRVSCIQTGKTTQDTTCNLSEGARQVAVAAAGNNQATVRAAEITHYRNVVASSKANNSSSDIAQVLAALRELGVSS
jgi:hypothetical protein